MGLILNEVATNSIKYAFGSGGGAIQVKLTGGVGYGEAQLTISDNGKGMTDKSAGGSGIRLVSSFKQIGGSLEIESSARGTTVSVMFPLIN